MRLLQPVNMDAKVADPLADARGSESTLYQNRDRKGAVMRLLQPVNMDAKVADPLADASGSESCARLGDMAGRKRRDTAASRHENRFHPPSLRNNVVN